MVHPLAVVGKSSSVNFGGTVIRDLSQSDYLIGADAEMIAAHLACRRIKIVFSIGMITARPPARISRPNLDGIFVAV